MERQMSKSSSNQQLGRNNYSPVDSRGGSSGYNKRLNNSSFSKDNYGDQNFRRANSNPRLAQIATFIDEDTNEDDDGDNNNNKNHFSRSRQLANTTRSELDLGSGALWQQQQQQQRQPIDSGLPVYSRSSKYQPRQHDHNNKQYKVRPTVEQQYDLDLDEDNDNEFITNATSQDNQLGGRNFSQLNQQQQQQQQDVNEELEDSDLEEVYLCICCGITKQLEPAMKYLAVFRSLFYMFNFLTFVAAFALLGFGLWFRIDPKVYELHKYIETQNFTIAGWIMLFGGFTVILLTLIGHRGATQKSIRSLLFYCITMTIITIGFIGSLVLLTVHGLGLSLERFMAKEIYDQIRRKAMSSELDLLSGYDATQFLDFVQVKLRCCGSIDFRDYQKLGMVIPATCYTFEGNYINAPGCAQAIRRLFDLRAGLASGFKAAAVISQLVSILMASMMICSIYNHRAQPRPVSPIANTDEYGPYNTAIKTPPPAQFEKRSRSPRDYSTEQRSRPGSRSSLTSIRV